jgi:hypothetical protein
MPSNEGLTGFSRVDGRPPIASPPRPSVTTSESPKRGAGGERHVGTAEHATIAVGSGVRTCDRTRTSRTSAGLAGVDLDRVPRLVAFRMRDRVDRDGAGDRHPSPASSRSLRSRPQIWRRRLRFSGVAVGAGCLRLGQRRRPRRVLLNHVKEARQSPAQGPVQPRSPAGTLRSRRDC